MTSDRLGRAPCLDTIDHLLTHNGMAYPMDIAMFPDGRMTASDAAAYLGIAPKTLAMKRSNGTGPKFVKRGRVFYFKDDLDEWLRAGRASSTAEARQLGTSNGIEHHE